MSKTKRQAHTRTKPGTELPVKFLFNHLNSPINIYDGIKGRFIYANPQFAKLAGMSVQELCDSSLDTFLRNVHADDLLVVINEVMQYIWDACSKYMTGKKHQVTFAINYRLRQKDEYIHVLVQSTVLEWDDIKKHSITMNLMTDITNHKKDHKISLTINVFDPKTQQWETVVAKEFLNKPRMLTERECEVMKLMVEEYKAAEIADKLGLNFYTVRAHWRNILTKTGCKTQKAFKVLAQREGWI